MYKICKTIDYESEGWKRYIEWRNIEIVEFESLDSVMNESMFEPQEDDEWKFTLSTECFLTSIVTDLEFAKKYAVEHGANTILSFDYIENEDPAKTVIGYDILDGDFMYSLLTNFGNDIDIVNRHLANNGLIKEKNHALMVYHWFIANMPEDPHVIGSRIFAVYNRISPT